MSERRKPGAPLTQAEEDVIELLTYGGTDKSMAQMLERGYRTVRDQVHSAKKKMGAKTRSHLVSLWIRQKADT